MTDFGGASGIIWSPHPAAAKIGFFSGIGHLYSSELTSRQQVDSLHLAGDEGPRLLLSRPRAWTRIGCIDVGRRRVELVLCLLHFPISE